MSSRETRRRAEGPAAGRVVTFYSYKGGVGRSMALANIAAVLAGWGRRVLCVDWDLEAAGLHLYFRGRLPEGWAPRKGVLDLFGATPVDWRELVVPVEAPGGGELALIAAGNAADDYVARLQILDWERGYREHEFGSRIEALREEWTAAYDVVLIDSRTGLSDIGGICTIQLPDVLVMLFSANRQSLDGTLDVARRAEAGRNDLSVTRPTLLVLPVVARFEGRTEVEKAQEWLRICAAELPPLYRNWLDRTVTPEELLRHTRIPAVPRWSFDESLPVLEEDRRDPDTVSYAYEGLAALLDRGLADTAELVRERDAFVKRDRWDFGFVVSQEWREEAARVSRLLKGRGYQVVYWGDFLLPGDDRDVAAFDFAEACTMLVAFTDAGLAGWVSACAHHGRRLAPVVKEGGKLPPGLGTLAPLRFDSADAALNALVRALRQPPRRAAPEPSW